MRRAVTQFIIVNETPLYYDALNVIHWLGKICYVITSRAFVSRIVHCPGQMRLHDGCARRNLFVKNAHVCYLKLHADHKLHRKYFSLMRKRNANIILSHIYPYIYKYTANIFSILRKYNVFFPRFFHALCDEIISLGIFPFIAQRKSEYHRRVLPTPKLAREAGAMIECCDREACIFEI